MKARLIRLATLGATLVAIGGGWLGVGAASADQPAAKAASGEAARCVPARSWRSWKAADDGRAMYVALGVSQVVRLDLTKPCPGLTYPDAVLSTRIDRAYLCRGRDIELHVARPNVQPPSRCLISQITPLSPEAARALPDALKP